MLQWFQSYNLIEQDIETTYLFLTNHLLKNSINHRCWSYTRGSCDLLV